MKRSTFKNFYAKRLKKVLFEQLKKNDPKIRGGGLNPPFQNSGEVVWEEWRDVEVLGVEEATVLYRGAFCLMVAAGVEFLEFSNVTLYD